MKPKSSESVSETIAAVAQQEAGESSQGNSEMLLQHRVGNEPRPDLTQVKRSDFLVCVANNYRIYQEPSTSEAASE